MAQLRFTRDQLIEALEARRPWAERLDAMMLLKHVLDEKAHLQNFRTACREAAKWDYETAKRNYFKVDLRNTRPSCPSSAVAGIDRLLAEVRASRQVRYVIDERGVWSRAHHLLTYDETIKAEMC